MMKTDKEIELLLNKDRKVVISSNLDYLSYYILAAVNKNNDTTAETILEIISKSFHDYVDNNAFRPSLSNPILVNISVFNNDNAKEVLEEHSLFAFFTTPLSTTLSLAIFDENIKEIPQESLEMMLNNIDKGSFVNWEFN